MASRRIRGLLHQEHWNNHYYQHAWNPVSSLLLWGAICNYTMLTEFVFSANPIVDETQFDYFHPLQVSAEYGDETIVR